jgi:hypothetical protein
MKPDKGLLKALTDGVSNYKASVPVFRIAERSFDDVVSDALQAGQHFAKAAGFGEMRYSISQEETATTIQFQEGIRAQVFHASGAMSLHRGWNPMERNIAAYADRADLKKLQRQALEMAKRLELAHPNKNEAFQFERLWQLKATGMTHKGKTGPIALTRVVGAFRRYIDGMPVWGRASIFVQLAAEGEVAAAGVDWRPIVEKSVDVAKVASPEEGAVRVLTELQTFLPNGTLTRKDYTPEFFSLGYFSLPKRRGQTVMQPVYVAMFKPVGPIPSLGRLIVVPAASKAYESIARTVVMPPLVVERPKPKVTVRKKSRKGAR